LWGYVVHYKDADVCSLIKPKDKNSRPICISQQVGPNGLSVEIMQHIMFEAKLDTFNYFQLLAKVKGHGQQQNAGKSKQKPSSKKTP